MAMQIKLESVASLFSEGCEDNEPPVAPPAMAGLRARRAAALHETWPQRLARVVQVAARALHPSCLASIAPTCDLLWRERIAGTTGLPDPGRALARPDGLAGLAADLGAANLINAYRRGLQARCLIGPATFWAPAQRLLAHPANLAVTKKLRGQFHKREYDVTIDHDFDALLAVCARRSAQLPRLNPKIMQAHADLFDTGAAHGFEVWDRKGKLIGGGYGIAIGRVFVLERMFGLVPQAAQLGLAVFAQHLAAWDFRVLDGSCVADLVADMGFAGQSRAAYNSLLDDNASAGKPGRWRAQPEIYTPRPLATAARRLFDQPASATPPDARTMAITQTELFNALGIEKPLSVAEYGRAKDCAA